MSNPTLISSDHGYKTFSQISSSHKSIANTKETNNLVREKMLPSTGRAIDTRVVVSNDHLILQRVSKEWTGNFSCSASNVVGDAMSESIQIIVQCE